jgi:hypothetical protein
VPLAYVLRENVEIPPGKDTSEGYIKVAEEMIAHAPHGNQAYTNESMQVSSYMSNITQAHDCWTCDNLAQRTKDGRCALLLMWDHFIGPKKLITWIEKQKLSLDRSVILLKERSGPGKRRYKFMPNNMQCSMA